MRVSDLTDYSRPAPPGLIRLAGNFAHDMARIAQGVVKGEATFALQGDREAHLVICRANTCGFYSSAQGRCLHPDCGCFCAAKAYFVALKCAAGLW